MSGIAEFFSSLLGGSPSFVPSALAADSTFTSGWPTLGPLVTGGTLQGSGGLLGGLGSLGSSALGGLGGLLKVPTGTVGGNLAMQGINGALGLGNDQNQSRGLAQMAPPSQSPQFRQPALNFGGQQAGGASQMGIPQMQVPQQMAMAQMSPTPRMPYQFDIAPMPQITPIKPPQGIDMPQLASAQQSPFAGPTPPYAQQGVSESEQYTQLLNYLRMNDLA